MFCKSNIKASYTQERFFIIYRSMPEYKLEILYDLTKIKKKHSNNWQTQDITWKRT